MSHVHASWSLKESRKLPRIQLKFVGAVEGDVASRAFRDNEGHEATT